MQRLLPKEINIMRMINHPSIIKIYEVYEDDTHIHIVLEYLKGGELFQHIKDRGIYEEGDAIKVMKHLLGALNYIHKRKIIHRDLKPENLIMADKNNESIVKIADFGLATIMDGCHMETAKCGSPGYVGINELNSTRNT